MQQAVSVERPRKRGRPPMTKEYADPMQSPMAHSSLQMQKQGLSGQNYTIPLMKVESVTPSPKKRRSGSSSVGSAYSSSMSVALAEEAAGGTKKGRYRGVLLSSTPKRINNGGVVTPQKSGNKMAAALEDTPASVSSVRNDIFSSDSRNYLRSSPPESTTDSPLKVAKGFHPKPVSKFNFCLSINEHGRASIGGAHGNAGQKTTVVGSGRADQEIIEFDDIPNANTESHQSVVDKSKLLTRLRQIKKDILVDPEQKIVKPMISISSPPPPPPPTSNIASMKSPKTAKVQNTAPSSLLPPSTPKSTFQFSTGFTPIAIDQILQDHTMMTATPKKYFNSTLDPTNDEQMQLLALSPRIKILSKQQTGGSGIPNDVDALNRRNSILTTLPQQEFVFKLSSGDPLLLTDDTETQWSSAIHNQLMTSPKRQICFNNSPSWINYGSPRAFSPKRRDSTAILVTTTNNLNQSLMQETKKVTTDSFEKQKIQDNKIAQFPVFKLNSSPPRDAFNTYLRRDSIAITSSPLSQMNITLVQAATTMDTNTKYLPNPTTPRASNNLEMPAMIECTPLIQRTMNGSLTSKYLSEPLQNTDSNIEDSSKTVVNVRDSFNNTSSQPAEQDDARLALKKLMSRRSNV